MKKMILKFYFTLVNSLFDSISGYSFFKTLKIGQPVEQLPSDFEVPCIATSIQQVHLKLKYFFMYYNKSKIEVKIRSIVVGLRPIFQIVFIKI